MSNTTDSNTNNSGSNSINPFSVPYGEDVKKFFENWYNLAKMPTIGPLYAFSKEIDFYTKELASLIQSFSDLKTNLDQYMSLVAKAYYEASTKTAEKAPKQISTKDDFDSYRKAMIDAFEDSFTSLYDSKDFAVVYGKLFSSQLDMSKILQTIAEKNLKVLNMPTRGEVDEILKDIHELKKTVRELKQKQQEINENGKTASTT